MQEWKRGLLLADGHPLIAAAIVRAFETIGGHKGEFNTPLPISSDVSLVEEVRRYDEPLKSDLPVQVVTRNTQPAAQLEYLPDRKPVRDAVQVDLNAFCLESTLIHREVLVEYIHRYSQTPSRVARECLEWYVHQGFLLSSTHSGHPLIHVASLLSKAWYNSISIALRQISRVERPRPKALTSVVSLLNKRISATLMTFRKRQMPLPPHGVPLLDQSIDGFSLALTAADQSLMSKGRFTKMNASLFPQSFPLQKLTSDAERILSVLFRSGVLRIENEVYYACHPRATALTSLITCKLKRKIPKKDRKPEISDMIPDYWVSIIKERQ